MLTNLWSVTPGAVTHPFLVNDNNSRGLAYNPVTGHLLVVGRTTAPAVHILDGVTGTVLGTLNFGGLVTGGTFAVNLAGITADGVIYVGNLTTDATGAGGPFKLYRWANESAQPELAYSGDPSAGNATGTNPRRFGDSLALRGTGSGTQILLGTYNLLVGLLQTTDGTNFTATKITTDAAAEDTRLGLAWGAGNTFWAKKTGGNLKQFSLNLVANTASTVTTVALSAIPGGPLDVDLSRNLVAFVNATDHRLLMYDIANPAAVQQQDANKNFPTNGGNGNGTGAVALRDGKLFALESNNGLIAYSVHAIYASFVRTPPASSTVWEGAEYWTFTVGLGGAAPFSYQWRFEGTNLPNATAASLTISNINSASQGGYSVVVSNDYGTATSTAGVLTMAPGNPSGLITNIWNLQAGSRPYLTTGYKEYGVAINPLTTNVLVLTRLNPTSMVAVLDINTGAEKHYIDYSGLTLSGSLPMNKIDVADDGTVYICNLTTTTATTPFTIYGIGNDSPSTTDKWIAFQGDPGNGATLATDGWGRTIAARGSGLNTEILVGTLASTARTVAILRPDANYAYTSTPITVSDAPAGFARLGLDWGPGNNTFWAKTASGNLILVEFDLGSQSGFVRKSYPQTGSRSVPPSLTGMKYDPASGLLAGLRNGSPPTPVSVSVHDVSDEAAGPLWVDQELFTTYNADIEFQGNVDFGSGYLVALGVNNGLKAFRLNSGLASLPSIVTHPASATWYRGTSPSFSVVADSATPMSYQWYLNDVPIQDATEAMLVVTNVQTSQAGKYKVRVTNSGGYRDSLAATLTLTETYTTAQMTNIWSLTAGSRYYLTTGYMEYGMAFNPATSNLLVISLASGTTVAVLDALTGEDRHVLDVSVVTGTGKVLHKIDVADDGVVYAGNLTTTAGSNPFNLYRWDNDAPTTVATVAFSGDPAPTTWPNKGCGYTLDARGAGVNTEILLSIGAWNATSNIVSILKTADGTNFTSTEIVVAAAPSGFARLGLCFGTGNTFWAKTWLGQLYLVEYNLAAGTGTILKTYSTALFPSAITSLAYDDGANLLAGAANDTQKNVQIYSVADLVAGPQLRDQELFPTYNPSIEANGELDFGGNYLFALNENNGLMAFLIDGSYVPPVTSFKILSATADAGGVTLNWEAQSGAKYQVLYAESLTNAWQTLGAVITATNSTATYKDNAPGGDKRFYRVRTSQ